MRFHFISLPNHVWVGISNWGCRVVSTGVQLVSIPLLLRSLGADQYAAYTIALSMMGWFALADLGTGSSIQNFASEARAKNESASTEIGIVALVSLFTVCIGTIGIALVSPTLGEYLFSGISGLSAETSSRIVLVTGIMFLMAAIGNVATKLLYGLGHGVAANLLTATASLLSLGLLWLATQAVPMERLLIPALLAYGSPLALAGAGASVVLFSRHGTWKMERISKRSAAVYKRARGFFIVALFATGVLNVDYLIMSQHLSPDQILIYNVLSRCFGIILALYSGLLAATGVYWSERIAANDWKQVIASWRIYIITGLSVVMSMTAIGAFSAQWALNLILPENQLNIAASTILLFGLYIGLRVWTDASTVALQAANETNVLIKWIPIQAVISICSQIFFVKIFSINGIILGLIFAFTLTVAWALPTKLLQISRIA